IDVSLSGVGDQVTQSRDVSWIRLFEGLGGVVTEDLGSTGDLLLDDLLEEFECARDAEMEVGGGLEVWSVNEIEVVSKALGVDEDEVDFVRCVERGQLPEHASQEDALPASGGATNEEVRKVVEMHPEWRVVDLRTVRGARAGEFYAMSELDVRGGRAAAPSTSRRRRAGRSRP